MWLFTRYGFYSAASARKTNGKIDPAKMMVRARCAAHLEQLKARFPALAEEQIVTLPGHDYGWRIFVSKEQWCEIVAELAHEQEWSNFKREAERFQGKKGSAYVDALHEVWGVMVKLQRGSPTESIHPKAKPPGTAPSAKSKNKSAGVIEVDGTQPGQMWYAHGSYEKPEGMPDVIDMRMAGEDLEEEGSSTEPIRGSRSVLDEPRLPDLIWDGITKPAILDDEGKKLRQHLADAAKNYEWPKVLTILTEHAELVNTTRPGGHSLYAPLHQAAHGGASEEIVLGLLRIGAWRTLRNSKGERPLDIARSKSRTHLLKMLEPVYSQDVPPPVLTRIQGHFHEVIRGRANRMIQENKLRLPELEPLLEFRPRQFWFTVPGMCGGFGYWLDQDGADAKLVTVSWCRVATGSGQRHEITASGSRLVEEGFV